MANPFSSPLPEEFWNGLIKAGELRTYERGEVLFQSGAFAEGVYLVEKGKISLQFASKRRKQHFESVGPGAILGLGQAMSQDCHKYAAEAATAAQVCFVGRPQLLEFLRITPHACMQVVRLLSEDLNRLYHTLCQQPFVPPRRRKP